MSIEPQHPETAHRFELLEQKIDFRFQGIERWIQTVSIAIDRLSQDESKRVALEYEIRTLKDRNDHLSDQMDDLRREVKDLAGYAQQNRLTLTDQNGVLRVMATKLGLVFAAGATLFSFALKFLWDAVFK